MTQEHSITPPPELVQQWVDDLAPDGMLVFATQAARWGADVELEACCEWFSKNYGIPSSQLRAARRPKPPSLKDQAIETLHMIRDHLPADMYDKTFLIRSALESLPD